MFTSSTAANLAQQALHPHHNSHLSHSQLNLSHQQHSHHQQQQQQQSHSNNNSSSSSGNASNSRNSNNNTSTNSGSGINSNLSEHQQRFVGSPFFSRAHQGQQSLIQQQNHQPSHSSSPASATSTVANSVPQFLSDNQHLVAHFSQQTATLAGAHFVDSLSAADANQFVSVMQNQQQQQNPQLQDGNIFNPISFFQHHSSTPQQLQSTTVHSSSNHHNLHQQQLNCANAITHSALASSIDSLNLTNAEHVILDQTNDLLRLHDGAAGVCRLGGLVNNNPTSMVVSALNEMRHQPRANSKSNTIRTDDYSNINNNNNLACNRGNNLTESASNYAAFSKSSSNTISNTNNNNSTSNNSTANNNHTNHHHHTSTNNSKNSNNKSKNNTNKKDKVESHRNAESPRRTFACPTCGKGFTEKFNMKRHMQIHSQSRPKYICNECSKSFAWKDNFIRHKKAAHGTSLPQYGV